jgi:hypothetical protein
MSIISTEIMENYPTVREKVNKYSKIIKEEHRKAKSDRRPDLDQIVRKQRNLMRWLIELKPY